MHTYNVQLLYSHCAKILKLLAVKRNRTTDTCAAARMNLKILMLSESSQPEKDSHTVLASHLHQMFKADQGQFRVGE